MKAGVTMVTLLVAAGAACISGGCESKAPSPPPGSTLPAAKSPLGKDITRKVFKYSDERALSLLGQTLVQDQAGHNRAFEAHQFQRPIEWKMNSDQNPCKDPIIKGPKPPEDDEIDFNVMPLDPSDGKNWPLFRSIVGPKGDDEWKIGEADEDDTNADMSKGEPILVMARGYGSLGGRRPIVRGKRSRAGAPGTWIAVESMIESGQQVDRYYLLNDVAGKVLRVWVNGSKTPTELTKGSTSYVKVGPSGPPEVIDFANSGNIDNASAHSEIRQKMRKIAECAGFDGGD